MNAPLERKNRRLVPWLLSIAAILASSLAVQAQIPLRYDFEIGERLVYERRVRVLPLLGETPLRTYREQIQFWCLARDTEDSFLFAELIRDQNPPPTETVGLAFHVDHRGQRRFSPEILKRLDGCDPILEFLPILPSSLEAGEQWLSPPDHYGRRWSCRHAADAADGLARIEFTLADPTGVAAALGLTQRGVMTYDPRHACMTRVEVETADPVGGRVQSVAVLMSRLKMTEVWCSQRLQEWAKMQRVLRQQDLLIDRLWNDADQSPRVSAGIERLWSEKETELSGPPDNPLLRYARAELRRARDARPRLREQGELAGRWQGVKAAQWSLQTPDGRTLDSETLRDRATLECFWSVSTLDSLRAFEQLRRLAATIPADQLRIVCLNIDADVVQARRAIDLCGEGLTHVLAGAPLDGAPPRDLPIFRLLTPDSRILGVYFGWQPNLAAYIMDRIR